MARTYPIRQVDPSELPGFLAVGDHAFDSTWPAEELLKIESKLFEPGRYLAAFDGSQPVGTTMSYAFTLTVPGGFARAAGVSSVGVLATHRRQGILTALMRRQLADVAAAGEPVAALFASESGIYRRFGYGTATEHYHFSILTGARRMATGVAELDDETAGELTIRLAEPQTASKDLMTIYDAVRAGQPGMISRSEQWWEALFSDPPFMREGQTPMRCVVAADGGAVRGYALYTAKPNWGEDGLPANELQVRELFATDPAANAALWRYLLAKDLVGQVNARLRPADDPLLLLLGERRAARPRASDGLWIRIIDLPAALTTRRYSGDVDIVIEVDDPLLPANSGRWRLRATGSQHAQPSCERTAAEPDIALGIAELGAAYLGGARLGSLARAGLVTELHPGTLAALSTAMSWDPLPWSPTMF